MTAVSPSPPHNLPAQRLPFFGRDDEIGRLRRLLLNSDRRLITVVGMGGVGKTSLALQAARQVHSHFPEGAWFVPLAEIEAGESGESEAIFTAIGAALDLPFGGDAPPSAQVLAYLRSASLLLILDNFEHLLPAADLILTLLEQAPRIKILVTSRQRLFFQSEQVLDLAALPVPASHAPEAGRVSSAWLFAERLRRHPGYHPDSPLDWGLVGEICRLTGGLPLALELAASWGRRLSLDKIAQTLRRDPGNLHTQLRDAPPRQRSMTAVFAASWSLLAAAEQQGLARLAVFPGSFTAESAAAVAEAPEAILAQLVAKSLLEEENGRYRLHPLLHEQAKRRLAAGAAEITVDQLRERHGRFYLQQLIAAEPEFHRSAGKVTLAAWRLDLANVRAAWQWAIAANIDLRDAAHSVETLFVRLARYYEGEQLLRQAIQGRPAPAAAGPKSLPAVAALHLAHARFLYQLSRLNGALVAIDRVLAALKNAEGVAALTAQTYDYRGKVLARQGKFGDAASAYQQAVDAARRNTLPLLLADALSGLGSVYDEQGKFSQAKTALNEALDLYQQRDYILESGMVQNVLGSVAWRLGNYEAAEAHYRETLTVSERFDFLLGRKVALANLGLLYKERGAYDQALHYYRLSLDLSRQIGDRWGEAMTWGNMGAAYLMQGDLIQAEQHLTASLTLAQTINDRQGEVWAFNHLSWLHRKRGEPEEAITWAERGLALAREIEDANNEAEALLHLGRAYLALEQPDPARRYAEAAATLFKEMGREKKAVKATAVVTEAEKGDENGTDND